MLDALRKLGQGELASWLDAHPFSAAAVGLGAVLVLAGLALWLTRGLLLPAFATMAKRSEVTWDDLLVEHRVFHRIAMAIPVVLIHQLVGWVPHLPAAGATALERVALCALVVVVLRALGAVFSAVNAIYARFPMAKNRPIKGYLQVILIVAWIFGAVVVVSVLMDRSPWLMLSGLGAMTAILLLVFRDTILSLVAGVQLTTNDLVRLGDWIELPQFGADGDVVDIGLHAVKVQNWDRTITVIPTHKFLEHSFKNWRGMSESGGRRIKRAFHVDMSTIRFLSEDEVERFGRYSLLSAYVAQKREELAAYNRANVTPGMISNVRRLTNVGTFRAWVVAYLRQHPKVHQEMTFLVRQLAPTAEGLPIEIYVFCNDIRWAEYEGVQADIFDHVLAMVPQFGLRVFQAPSGHDIGQLARAPGIAQALQVAPEEPAAPVRNTLRQD
jgi:miniconductance mechanosensitive channel